MHAHDEEELRGIFRFDGFHRLGTAQLKELYDNLKDVYNDGLALFFFHFRSHPLLNNAQPSTSLQIPPEFCRNLPESLRDVHFFGISR